MLVNVYSGVKCALLKQENISTFMRAHYTQHIKIKESKLRKGNQSNSDFDINEQKKKI